MKINCNPLCFIIFSALLLLNLVLPYSALCDFPNRPVKIIVYTGPGGLIDITARKLADIMKKRYSPQPVLVENRKGAGGIVALSYVIRKPADGYTIFGLTSSVISKTLKAGREDDLYRLYYLARVAKDYECIITRKQDNLPTLTAVTEDAGKLKGRQIWVGPAPAGTDHLFALKVWRETGISAPWIPYQSGSRAIAALLGGHARVYVGNPGDTTGRPDLHIAAVAAPHRLPSYPEVKTFAEQGFKSLSEDVLWRGFAVKKGTPDSAIRYLTGMFKKALQDPEWNTFIRRSGMIPVYEYGKRFARTVREEIVEDSAVLEGRTGREGSPQP